MTQLSSDTQAILIAEAKSRCLREERDCHPSDPDWNGCYICVHRRGLADALRVAADQFYTDWDGLSCEYHLRCVAAELDGAQPSRESD